MAKSAAVMYDEIGMSHGEWEEELTTPDPRLLLGARLVESCWR
jgi:hypothetical protein